MMTERIQLKECLPDEQISRGDASDVSDPGNYGDEALQLDVEYRDASQIHHTAEACTSGIPNGHAEKMSSPFVDDSSSTCSSDSVPSVVNGPYKGITSPTSKNKRNSARRGNKQQNKETRNSSTSNAARLLNVNGSSSAAGPEPKVLIYAFKDKVKKLEQTFFKKSFKEEVGTITRDKIILKDQIDEENPCFSMTTESSSSSTSHSKKTVIKTEKIGQVSTPELTSKILIKAEKIEEVPTTKLTSKTLFNTEKSASLLVKSPQCLSISKSEAPKHQASSISRPYSAPVIPSPKPTVSFVSTSQTVPQLARTLRSMNCLNSEPSLFSQNSEPQSYQNAILGINTATNARKTGPNLQTSNSLTQSTSFFHPSSSSVNPGIFFGSVRPESLHDIRIGLRFNGKYWAGLDFKEWVF